MAITIGIPFYNAEKFLADAIKSVFAQTYTEWELLLIDDGSTDNSLKIAKSISDPRVKVYSDGKNKKLASRLNQIVSLAKYDLIARMDADDLMSTIRLEKQINILEKKPRIDLISTGVISIKDNLDVIGIRGENYNKISLKDLLYKNKSIVHASILGRKSWFQRNKYNETLKIAQDYDLWLRAAKKNDLNIISISDPLYYYREENNVTYIKLKNAYENERKMYIKYGGKHKYELVLKSYIKSFIIYFLNEINKIEILLNKRNLLQQNAYFELFKKDIEIIKKTKVEGLNS